MPNNDATKPPEGAEPGFEPPASQAALDEIIERRLTAERARYADYDELKAKAARFDEAEQAGKSELQKVQEKLEAAMAENGTLKSRALAAEVAAAKKLPPAAAQFLGAGTREELEARADQLLALTSHEKQPPKLAGAGAPPPEGPRAAEIQFMKTLLEKE